MGKSVRKNIECLDISARLQKKRESSKRESEIERRLVEFVTKRGGLALKWISSVAGVPDRCVIHRGRVIFVELKSPVGGLSKIQTIRHKELKAAGATVEIIRTFTDIQRMFL